MSKEPIRNVYVGHRYVPKIMGEWDKSIDYEGLSIVTNQGTSYTSKKRVPVGIDISNEEFWVVTGNYNAQVEYYRQETERVSEKLDEKADIEELEEFKNEVNTDFDLFKQDTNEDINVFKNEVNTDFDLFKQDTNENINNVKNDTLEVIKDLTLNVKDFGAIGDGKLHPLSERFNTLEEAKKVYPFVTSLNQEIDWASIQKAVNENAGKRVTKIPAGTYRISDTIVLPVINVFGRRNSLTNLVGETRSLNYKDTVINTVTYGTTLYATNKDVTVLSTAEVLPPPEDNPWAYQHGWSRDFRISTLNIIGRQAASMNWNDTNVTNKYSVGLNINGAHSCEVHDVSVEGFGQGIRVQDAIVNFTGETRVANNYRGLEATRSSHINDCILRIDKLFSLVNKICVSLDNCRVFNMLSGGIQNAETSNEIGTPIFQIKNSVELDVNIHNATLESNRLQSDIQPLIHIDEDGIDTLTINNCNVTSLVNSHLIRTKGQFSSIVVNESIFHGSTLPKEGATHVSEFVPLVDIALELNTPIPDSYNKAMILTVEKNSPADYQAFIKSNYKPLSYDFIPSQYKQVNVMSNADKVVWGSYEPFNTNLYNSTTANVMKGNARLYFVEDDPGHSKNHVDVFLTDTKKENPLTDVNDFIVTILVNSDGGKKVPLVYNIVSGDETISYFDGVSFTQRYVHVSTTNINGVRFDKYNISVRLNKNDNRFSKGITSIRISNIKGGSEDTGIDYIKVYANTKRLITETNIHGVTSAGHKSGYWKQGDVINKINPVLGEAYKYICIESGLPGTWKSIILE